MKKTRILIKKVTNLINNSAKNVNEFPNSEYTKHNDNLTLKNEERTKTSNKKKTDVVYERTTRNKVVRQNTFEEIFKYKQSYMDEEKFLNKNDFMKNKNEYNLFSNDNVFNLNQINKNQIDINKKTKENKVK